MRRIIMLNIDDELTYEELKEKVVEDKIPKVLLDDVLNNDT